MARKRTVGTQGPYLLSALKRWEPGDYTGKLPAVRHLRTLDFHPKVTFFIGENGSGKSTLLEALAVQSGLNAEGGSRNFRFETKATHSEKLTNALRLSFKGGLAYDSFFLRAESFYNVASEIERLDEAPGGGRIMDSYGGKSLHKQSHGQSFMALFENRFNGDGLYFLDEPEAALSPNRQLNFLALLHAYCEMGAQFIIATHSPIIMAYPNAWIYEFTDEGLKRKEWEETDHYMTTKMFLTHPKRMLRGIMEEATPKEEPSE